MPCPPCNKNCRQGRDCDAEPDPVIEHPRGWHLTGYELGTLFAIACGIVGLYFAGAS